MQSRKQRGRAGLLLPLAAAVSLEDAGRRELAELVPDHVLDDEQPQERPAVVDEEGVADELRDDRTVARPRLDRLPGTAPLLPVDLGEQAFVDVRAFFQRTTHVPGPLQEKELLYVCQRSLASGGGCRDAAAPGSSTHREVHTPRSPGLTSPRSAGRDDDDG